MIRPPKKKVFIKCDDTIQCRTDVSHYFMYLLLQWQVFLFLSKLFVFNKYETSTTPHVSKLCTTDLCLNKFALLFVVHDLTSMSTKECFNQMYVMDSHTPMYICPARVKIQSVTGQPQTGRKWDH